MSVLPPTSLTGPKTLSPDVQAQLDGYPDQSEAGAFVDSQIPRSNQPLPRCPNQSTETVIAAIGTYLGSFWYHIVTILPDHHSRSPHDAPERPCPTPLMNRKCICVRVRDRKKNDQTLGCGLPGR